jgi:hypothetical protein
MLVQTVVPVLEAGGRLISLGWWVKFLDLHWYSRVSQCSLAVFRAQAADDIIRRMGFACWIPKAINTHSECAVLAYRGNSGYENALQCYYIRLLPVLSLPWCRCGVINTAWHSALKLTWQVFMFSYVSSVIYWDCSAVYCPTAFFRSVSLNQRFAILFRTAPKIFISRGTPTYEHETKRQFVVHWDYSSIGNYSRDISRYIWNFCDMSEILFIYSTISRGTHNAVQLNPYWGAVF